ncbi:MAG: integrase core domain-containing protein [Phreatobacter sp.]
MSLKHIRARPYTPKHNGKAQRFIQTCLREWACARAHQTSDERADELPFWMHAQNFQWPHGRVGSRLPISRLTMTRNNVLSLHS